jgi:hypothetical protein
MARSISRACGEHAEIGQVMAKSRKKILVKLKISKTRYLGVLPTVVSKGTVLVHSDVRPQTQSGHALGGSSLEPT